MDNMRHVMWHGNLTEEQQESLYGDDLSEVTNARVITVFGGDSLRRLFVIAERTENGINGRLRREMNAQFSEAQIKVLSKWRTKIRAWLLLTGIPYQGVRMKPSTYMLLRDFADFFASN